MRIILLFLFWTFTFAEAVNAQIVASSDTVIISANGDSIPAEAGKFRVSIDGESSPYLNLRYLRLRPGLHDTVPPVVFLAGGPGGSSVEAVANWPLLHKLSDSLEVIALAQRGTAGGSELRCPYRLEYPDTLFGTPERYNRYLAEAARRCINWARENNIPIKQYTTQHAIRDLIEFRRALGIKRWSLFGGSYGTSVAYHLAATDSKSVSRMFLWGTNDPATVADPGIAMSAQLQVLDSIATSQGAPQGSLIEHIREVFKKAEDGLIAPFVDRQDSVTRRLAVSRWDLEKALVDSYLHRRNFEIGLRNLLNDILGGGGARGGWKLG